MNIFGGIFGTKKDEEDHTSNAHSHNTSQKQVNSHPHQEPPTQQAAANSSLFGGFVQVKRKPSGSLPTAKPKAFDPFNMSAAKPGASSNQNVAEGEQGETNTSFSGHGSLSRLDEAETPKATGDSLPDVNKRSAFGFIQKKPIKPQEVQPTQNLSFVSNVKPDLTELYASATATANESYADGNNTSNMLERRSSLSSNASENVTEPKPKNSAFSFIKKKPTTDPESQNHPINQSDTSMKKQISLNLETSQHDLGSARASSDTKSDTAEGKNVTTPPASSSSHIRFNGRSPGSSKKSEADTNQQTLVPEPNLVKPSGPSFGKFRKPVDSTPKVQTGTPAKMGSPGISDKALSNKNDSPHSSSKGSTKTFKNRLESQTIQSESMAVRVEKITSPLQAIQTPAVQNTPEDVQARVEKEKNEIIENIGNLISRQNGLMEKKSSLESRRENATKKMKLIANQQNEAIENDNFEEADHLEVVIIELNETMRDLEKQIDDCQLEYTDLEKEKQMLYQSEALLFKSFIGEIEELLLTQNYNYEKYKLECQSQQSTEKSYIEEKTKELQYIRNHIELDLKHINEENSQVQETLNRNIKDFVVERDDLTKRKEDLEHRIEEIKRELKAQEEELVDVAKNLGKVTTKITGITSKFDDQLNKIKRRRDKVNEEEEKYQSEVKKLDKHKETVENSIRRLEEVSENYTKMLENYNKLSSKFTEDSERLDNENLKREKAIKLYYNSLNGLRQEKRQLLNCEEEVDKLKDELSRVQKETNNTFSHKNTLANKIPSLEKEKKEFVSTRNFKEASRISNEIKEIQTKIIEIDERLNELSENEKQTAQKINTLERDTIPSLKTRVNTISKECNLNKYELLKVKEEDLKLIHNHYVAQKLYEDAHVIDAELKAAQKQLAELLSEHPELNDREKAQNVEKEKKLREQQDLEREKERKEVEERNKEATHMETQQQQNEAIPQIEETVDTENAEVAEKKTVPLGELIVEYDENKTNIEKMEEEIDKLATDELYAEAEEVSERQGKLKTRQDEIIGEIHCLGFDNIEEARASAGKPNENQNEVIEEVAVGVEELNDENKDVEVQEEKGEERENEVKAEENNEEQVEGEDKEATNE